MTILLLELTIFVLDYNKEVKTIDIKIPTINTNTDNLINVKIPLFIKYTFIISYLYKKL